MNTRAGSRSKQAGGSPADTTPNLERLCSSLSWKGNRGELQLPQWRGESSKINSASACQRDHPAARWGPVRIVRSPQSKDLSTMLYTGVMEA
jgi:hypothetical protein